MGFKFTQLDTIYDSEKGLNQIEQHYVPALLKRFVQSPEGKAYLAAHPDEQDYVGDWIGNLVYMGYAYLNATPPRMREADVRSVLLDLFPSKISLYDPGDAATIVPELIAFWLFVQREFKQPNSKQILAFLYEIEPTFPKTMNNPTNFGLAKSLFMDGQAAGFEMTTPAGLDAFQKQHNPSIQQPGMPPGFLNLFQSELSLENLQQQLMTGDIPEGVPPEFVALLSQQLGLGSVPGLENLPSDPEQLIDAIARHLIESDELDLEDEANPSPDLGAGRAKLDIFQDIKASIIASLVENQRQELSPETIAQLEQQTITETEPGTIVKDFETLLEAMGDTGLPVSGKLQQFQLKVLGDLNEQLSHPIQIALKRPQQKSYPNLHGLYLLLRATGIAEISGTGKKLALRRNGDRYASWQILNPTEKYFTLLEAWMLRGDSELLGDQRSPYCEGMSVLKVWPQMMAKRQTFSSYNEQSNLLYWPGFHNLALMQMFGWVTVKSVKPDPGKGWRVKEVKPQPIGDALVKAITEAYYQESFAWASETNVYHSWGELQPYLQSYFSEWQNNLVAPEPLSHQTGTFIFKVSLGQAWRRISISSESTLAHLSRLILQSVKFDSDHLDQFSFKNAMGRTIKINHPHNDWKGGPYTDEVRVGDLPLEPGMVMDYLFDFGDCWEFTVLLEDIQPGQPKGNSNKILEYHGDAPEQYPDWDE